MDNVLNVLKTITSTISKFAVKLNQNAKFSIKPLVFVKNAIEDSKS